MFLNQNSEIENQKWFDLRSSAVISG